MKKLIIILLFSLTYPIASLAHCPAALKSEKVCFMLDSNLLYVYDHKLEHNGPYKDLVAPVVFKNEKGEILKSTKAARGIYKLEAPVMLNKVLIESGTSKISVLREKS